MKKLLVIDDDKNLRTVYSKALPQGKYAVTLAESAEQALELISSISFDAVVVDLNLPNMQGDELFQKIREKYENLKIVVSSVYPVEEQKERIPAANAHYDKSKGLDGLEFVLDEVLLDDSKADEVKEEIVLNKDKIEEKSRSGFFQDRNVWIAVAVILGIVAALQFWHTSQLSKRVDDLTEQAYLMGRGAGSVANQSTYGTGASSGYVLDPFADLAAFERLFDGMMGNKPMSSFQQRTHRVLNPKINVADKGNYYLVTMEMPGIDKDNIAIDINEGVLTVAAERTTERGDDRQGRYYHREVYSGVFQKSMRLPEDVDVNNVKADYKDGVLKLRLNKKAALQKKSRPIPIKVSVAK